MTNLGIVCLMGEKMQYTIKCSICGKDKTCEPETHGDVRTFLVSYTCDECKRNLIKQGTQPEDYKIIRGPSILSGVIKLLYEKK